MNRRSLIVLVLLLLLAAGWFVLRPAPSSKPDSQAATDLPRGDVLLLPGASCCESTPNETAKDQGRILVSFPESANVSGTMVYAYRPGESKAFWIQVGGGETLVPDGTYDIEVQKVRFTNVRIEAGRQARVKAGVLRVGADNQTTYEVLDSSGQRTLGSGFGHSVFGLPAGAYGVRINGGVTPVVVEDGKVAELGAAAN